MFEIPVFHRRKSTVRQQQVRNILIVWVLTGVWHGAGWNFLLWGLYYALWMLAARVSFRNPNCSATVLYWTTGPAMS